MKQGDWETRARILESATSKQQTLLIHSLVLIDSTVDSLAVQNVKHNQYRGLYRTNHARR
jgi:hypothetical protein